MTLKGYSIIMGSSTAVCWALWLAIVTSVDPQITNWIGFALFYSSLFLALLGTSALAGFLVRFILMKRSLAFKLVKEAFRQSFFFSFLIIASLYLLSKGLFSWMNVLLLVAGLSILEFFLLSLGANKH